MNKSWPVLLASRTVAVQVVQQHASARVDVSMAGVTGRVSEKAAVAEPVERGWG